MRWLLSRDPTMFALLFGAWGVLVGVSLLLPGDAFRVAPAYSLMRKYPVPEEVWGAGALICGGLMIASVMVPSRTFRGAVAVLGWVYWVAFGVIVTIGAMQSGVFAAAGGFSMLGAALCFIAVGQWERRP